MNKAWTAAFSETIEEKGILLGTCIDLNETIKIYKYRKSILPSVTKVVATSIRGPFGPLVVRIIFVLVCFTTFCRNLDRFSTLPMTCCDMTVAFPMRSDYFLWF